MSTTGSLDEATPQDDQLLQAWRAHVSRTAEPLEDLIARHRAPGRHYHGVHHVHAVVTTVIDLAARELVAAPNPAVAAAFFHDAIYDPMASDNEARSADLARRRLGGLGWIRPHIDRVTSMIEATSDHLDPIDREHAVLFDADLAILGTDVDTYDGYVAAVRLEYSAIDDGAWRTGRRAVLSGFLERPSIYSTVTGVERWEVAARDNLAREYRALAD